MPRTSAGLLMYRIIDAQIEVLLVHPGGPFWKNKDDGHWTFPRGEVEEAEDLLAAARREFEEETGFTPSGPFIPLGEIRQKSSKHIAAWAFPGDCDPTQIRSNTFEMEWPPKSGKRQKFPEIDRGAFFNLDDAGRKLRESETPFLARLKQNLQQK